ncbi:MAG: peptidylprolyl isomerase FKBP-type [Candidatus Parvarchaeum acidiphilum ARMAN-4]|jgi:FKBP-type peptidyl-prolyl cis-trans isomerase 2|uniref:Peptidyl-prolyl cis-trans isomerase n=1 Tax=Candidatus Parvarchaeum acidiphilum ARMAN-4 TaxID=662760 RepID=D2EFD0_PARA4|nr:MAG: peptidylprolyl isomerase FKBP-type [Candidatus Parvarchaeum acidiphilum ARMAN-4]
MIKENDFVMINFVGRITATNRIFDLTDKKVADQENITGDYNFSPVLVIPSGNYVLKAISDSLIGKNVGDKYSIIVPPKDGFGEFDKKLIKTYGISVFRSNNINPSVGDMILLDDKMATVLAINSGRVMVSYNHPLAGKELKYEIEILSIIENDIDKYSAIFQHYTGKAPEKVDVDGENIKIFTKEEAKPYIKDSISMDIAKYINKSLKTDIIND